MTSICLLSVSKMVRPISMANGTKQVSSELFAVFKTGLSLNSNTLCLGTNSKLRSKGTDGHVSSQGRRTVENCSH